MITPLSLMVAIATTSQQCFHSVSAHIYELNLAKKNMDSFPKLTFGLVMKVVNLLLLLALLLLLLRLLALLVLLLLLQPLELLLLPVPTLHRLCTVLD